MGDGPIRYIENPYLYFPRMSMAGYVMTVLVFGLNEDHGICRIIDCNETLQKKKGGQVGNRTQYTSENLDSQIILVLPTGALRYPKYNSR